MRPVLEEEQPPSICLFLTGLEDAMEAKPLALAHDMNLYVQEAFAEFSREYLLDKVCMFLADPRWVPDADPIPLPDYSLTGFPAKLRNVAATYGFWLSQAMEAIHGPGYLTTEGDWEWRYDYS